MIKNYPILKKLVPLFFLLFSVSAFSQTIIKSQSFDSGASGYADNLLYTVSDATYVNLSSTTSESSSNSLRFSNNNGTNDRDSNVIFDNIDISAYSNVSVTVSFKAINVDKDEDLYLDISYNGGSSYTSTKLIDGDNWNENIDWGFPDTDGTTTSNPYTFLVPAVNNQIKIRISASNLDDDDFFYIDNIIIKSDKYCSSNGNNTNFEYINRVQFNTIDNVSGTGTTSTGYSNFLAISTTVTQGSDYEIMITPTWTGSTYNEGYSVWIDYNQDGDFDDVGEQVFTQPSTKATLVSGTFKIPATASLGNTGMRISMSDAGVPLSCGSFNYGEVEDYTINITSPTGTYCVSNGNNTNDEYIGRVQLNTFNNPSGPGTTSTGYSDFTSMSTDLIYCALNTITITPTWTASTYSEGYSVWIDYNQDGDFLDFDEQVFTQPKTTTTPVSGTFTIPLSAIPGTTRMRVSMKYYGIPTACESFIYGEVEDYTIIINSINTWNGSKDKDWNEPLNWCIGVPTVGIPSTLDVVIPAGLTNYPIIYAGDASGYVENIDFEIGSTLNVKDNYLQVTMNLTLNGKIDLEGESQLVQDTGSAFDAASTGNIEIDQQGTSDNFRYNYWGSPVNTTGTSYTIAGVLRDGTVPAAINEFNFIDFGAPYAYADVAVTSPIRLSTYWMYKYANLGIGYSGWTRVGKDGNLNAGEGFTMKGSNTNLPEQNYTFVGKPNNGDINLTISANNDYLIGNPYPSAIDAQEFIKDNISGPSGRRTLDVIDGNLYFWDHFGGGSHLLKSYEGGYGIVNLTGETKAMATDALINNTGNTSTKIPPKFIPVAQGFFVTAVSGIVGTENIQFKNSQRLYKKENPAVSQFMKSAKFSESNKETEDEDTFPKIYLKYSSPKGFHRQILVGFIENTTDGIDIGYDAVNYETFAEDMSWRTNNINFIIQAVPTLNDERILPIEVKVAASGIVKISIDNAENIPDGTEIFIKDSNTGEMHNVSQKTFEINLEAGKYTDRFALTFKTQKLVAEDVNAEILIPAATQPIIEGIHVFMNNATSELQIKNNSTEEILSVALINTVGQTVKTWNSNFNIRTVSLPISTATGVYLVQINTKTGNTVKKISVE